MSTRSRAAPWFVDGPQYVRVSATVMEGGYVEWRREWSWNALDWFDYAGNVVVGQRWAVLEQLDAQVPFAEVRMLDGADPFLGHVS